MGGSRKVQGIQTPPPPPRGKNYEKYSVSLQYWSGSPENHKAAKTGFNGGPSSARHFNGVLLAGRWWPNSSGIWILHSPYQLKKEKKSYQIWPPLTKLSESAHDILYDMCGSRQFCQRRFISDKVFFKHWTLAWYIVALWLFRGSGPVLLGNPIFCDFSEGVCPRMSPSRSSHVHSHGCSSKVEPLWSNVF